MKLKLDYCSHEAAKFACLNWHYSKCMPVGKLVKIGVWEDDKFIGAVIFGRGANCSMYKHFDVLQDELAELCRVALTKHKTPVSRILKISIILLKKICPDLKLIFSYADETNQGHKGGIYIADNWKCLGKRTSKGGHFLVNGTLKHARSINAKFGNIKEARKYTKIESVEPQVKYLFVKYLSAPSLKVKPQAIQLVDSGSNPTDALH